MKRQEQLREQYEDIVFAMMMDELAAEQGRAALEENERLQQDPAAAVPEHIDRACMQTIRGQFRRERARRTGRATLKAMGRVAMAFGVLSALFLCAFAASEDLRSKALNLMIETIGESTEFYFSKPKKDQPSQITAGWMIEGFYLEDEETDELQSWVKYRNGNDQSIYCLQIFGDGQLMSIDTEGAEVTTTLIHGVQATVACQDGDIQIIWALNDEAGFIYLCGCGVSQEDLIRVAENLQY